MNTHGSKPLTLVALTGLTLLSLNGARAQVYQFNTVVSLTTNGPNLQSPSINNQGDVLFAGPTQSGNQVFLNGLNNNIAAASIDASGVQDTRLPRFGMNSSNAVWNANTTEIDPVTKALSPGSNYQEDRIYLSKNGGIGTLIGQTAFVQGGTLTSAFASPDVNDAGQTVFRRLNYNQNFQWDLLLNDGSGSLAGTSQKLTLWNSIGTPFINNSGKVAFYGRVNAADSVALFNLNGVDLTSITPTMALTSPGLRDFSDDGNALIFDGSNTTGSFYTIDGAGNTMKLLTAGTAGLNRVELGQRNNKGQVVFGNRTLASTGGAAPNAGQSDLYLYSASGLIPITSNPLGTAVISANINDRGDLVYITQQYLYDSAGAYTGQRRLNLIVGTAVPEPGALALLAGLVIPGIVLLRRRRGGMRR